MAEVNIELILVQLFVLVLLARIAAYVCEKSRVPVVIGEILMGIVIANIGINGITLYAYVGLDQDPSQVVFVLLATLGVIFLLFAVGLESPFSELNKVGKVATIVAILGVILPFIGGLLLMLVWGTSMIVSLFIAAALVATSVGITARVIKDLGLMDTIEARVIIAAAVIDDILGLIVLAMVSGVAQGGALNLIEVAVVAGLAVGFVLLVMFISSIIPRARTSPQVTKFMEKRKPSRKRSLLPLALIVCFGLSALASYLSLAAIVGAFLAGMVFAEFRDIWPGTEKFEPINEFLVPFFFLYIGVRIQLGAFGTMSIIILTILLTIVAIITKFAGCAIGAKSLGARSATIVGVGMIPRGEVGLTVAFIGLSAGVLQNDMYTVIVAMALITTLVAPYLVTHAFNLKNKPRLKKMKPQKGL
ncbi:MAG: cation:proton antiporter [Methanomassiliicoccales archaeon]|nr:cation:proton antiporter [Methanomassiliicoccales archaeon]